MEKDSDPLKIDDRYLLAYLDGEADAETVAQIEASEELLKRARQLDQLQKRLKAKLYRVNCPETFELGEFHLGILSRKRSKEIKRHLIDCPHCQRELAQLQDFLQEENRPETPGLYKGIKVLIARLVRDIQAGSVPGDLAWQPADAALRGTRQGPITLEADGNLIILEFLPASGGKLQVLGQFAGDNLDLWTGALVEMNRDGETISAAHLDDLGTFRFDELEPGRYDLVITPAEGPVILANIEIGPG